MSLIKTAIHYITISSLGFMLSGCMDTVSKLKSIGKPPAMAAIENPTAQPQYQPVSWPLPAAQPPGPVYANSLWQPGSRAFFRDQRAARVGDILRVNIKIKDKAELDNQTQRKRDSTEALNASAVFGLENKIYNLLPGSGENPANLLDTSSSTDTKGNGNIKRKETIETQVAAMVTQILPNGNLVIEGKQEIRINYEIRQVSVQGVVRTQDISTENTVDSTQIAEARIDYGGRGQLFDVQQPRWGNQVIEAISPF